LILILNQFILVIQYLIGIEDLIEKDNTHKKK